MEQNIVNAIVEKVIKRLVVHSPGLIHPKKLGTGVSNRHVHLSKADLEALFGKGYVLQKMRNLSQTGQFAAVETVIIAGPKGSIENVRILGPVRKQTQVEVSGYDSYNLGVLPPVRESGNLSGSPGITLIGPKGSVRLDEGLIIAKRHIHMTPLDARNYGVKDGDKVQVCVDGERGMVFNEVVVRVNENYVLEFHIDVDEANASGIRQGDTVSIVNGNSSTCIEENELSKERSAEPDNNPEVSLVTEEEVRKANRNKKTLIIKKGAIITPLAKDTMKELKVDFIMRT